MKPPLHRESKQHDAETLSVSLQTCCAYTNSALVEDGSRYGGNEFYYRVVEQYIEIDEATPDDLEKVAKILEALAEQFRTSAQIYRDYNGAISTHLWGEKAEAKEEEDEGELESYDVKTGKKIRKE